MGIKQTMVALGIHVDAFKAMQEYTSPDVALIRRRYKSHQFVQRQREHLADPEVIPHPDEYGWQEAYKLF